MEFRNAPSARLSTRRAILASSLRFGLLAGMVAVSPLVLVRGAAAQDNLAQAERFIAGLGEEVLAVLNRPGLSMTQAVDEFSRLFQRGFDIPTISRFVLGRYWNVASTDERREFVRLFESMITHTYARRFSEYSGEQFIVSSVREETDTDTIVITDVRQPGNPNAVQVAWRLRQRDTGPQIIDVIIEGVSMGVTQRQEFASVIERSGGSVEALLARMREQVARLQ